MALDPRDTMHINYHTKPIRLRRAYCNDTGDTASHLTLNDEFVFASDFPASTAHLNYPLLT